MIFQNSDGHRTALGDWLVGAMFVVRRSGRGICIHRAGARRNHSFVRDPFFSVARTSGGLHIKAGASFALNLGKPYCLASYTSLAPWLHVGRYR